jgi:hypothetical protein
LVTLGHVRENHVLRPSAAESPSKTSEPLPAPHEMINMVSLVGRDVPPSEDALPPGWEVGQDQAGNKYFYNKGLNVTQWNRPAVDGLVVETTQIQKCKTKEICSLPARPDFDFSDLQMWLTLSADTIQNQSFVEDILRHQELRDNFLELVLESSTPLLVSVRYAGAFHNYASLKRSENMRMADDADEQAVALEHLACAITREDNFASLLISSSKFTDLTDDASVAKNKFYEELTDALRLATFFKLKAFVNEPLIAALVRNLWCLTTLYKLCGNLTVYNFSPAFRYWSNQISYIILCVLAWFLKPGVG